MRLTMLFVACVLGACSVEVQTQPKPKAKSNQPVTIEYGFLPGAVRNDETGGFDFTYVSVVACKGPAVGKLDPGDAIIKVNDSVLYHKQGIGARAYEDFVHLIATARVSMSISVLKGGLQGESKTYLLKPGPTSWSLEDCRKSS